MMQAVSNPQTHIPPGHSGRLRYATPQELPSYPSIGLRENGAAASAAATLGWANQKTVEPWKPAHSSSASTAALLANDYRMPPVRETERSSAPYQAAALAAGSAQRSHRQEPVSLQSTWGNSAANMAFKAANASTSQSAKTDKSLSLSRQQSLRGAKGAVAGARPRSMSTPQKYTYPDQANASANALNAATVANRPSAKAKFDEAGAVPYTTMSREMFSSHPPVKLEVDEKRHTDSLHASAVAMAKRMYTQQQKMIESAKHTEASTAAARSSSFSRHGGPASDVESNEHITTGFPNLQEAAYRLAQERLVKLHEEHQKNREFQDSQDWYGSSEAQRHPGRMGSIRGKLTRRRSSSDGDLVEDRKRSQQIRQQMSMFNTKLTKVDEEKRARDREALLAAAQRNVKAQLEGMDRKLYEDTGRVPPSRLNDWEAKAHSAALLRAESTKNENAGKVDLGAGKFMDQEEVMAIAAKRVQPVIDDINRKAEDERERQMTAKLEEERRKEELERDKQRDREVQDIHKKLKDQQKEEARHRKAEAKEAEKARKEQERAAKADEKRLAKEEKERHKEATKPVAIDQKEKTEKEDHHGDAAPSSPTLIAPVPPVAIAPVAPVATDATQATSPTVVESKGDSKSKKEDEKAAKAEQKRLAKEEKRKSRSLKKPLALDLKKRVAKEDHQPATAPLDGQHTAAEASNPQSAPVKERSHSFSGRRDSSPHLDGEPRSPTHRIKNWFSSHFSRPRTKSSASATAAEGTSLRPGSNGEVAVAEGESGRGFIGGAALRRREGSSESEDSSLRDVAFASVSRDTNRRQLGLPTTVATTQPEREPSPSRSVSSVSSVSSVEEDGDRFVEASEGVGRPLTPPPPRKDLATIGRLSVSPGRGSRFSEIID